MKQLIALFALVLMLGFAARMGALEPVRDWLMDHHEEASLTPEQIRATLDPELFTLGNLFEAFSRLPPPWAAMAKGGFILLGTLLVLSLIAAVLRMMLNALRWLREIAL